jgi:hypothetical protein
MLQENGTNTVIDFIQVQNYLKEMTEPYFWHGRALFFALAEPYFFGLRSAPMPPKV